MVKKRDIFAELVEGFQSLLDERLGQIALRTYVVGLKSRAPTTTEEIIALRGPTQPTPTTPPIHTHPNQKTETGARQERQKPLC